MKHSSLFASLLLCPVLCWSQMAIIVHPSNAAAKASPEQVANVFMGKVESLPGSSPLTPVDQPPASSGYASTYSWLVGKDAAQMRAYWARVTFTGKGKPPTVMATDEDVRKHVASTPGAIGYVSKSAADKSVAILLSQ